MFYNNFNESRSEQVFGASETLDPGTLEKEEPRGTF